MEDARARLNLALEGRYEVLEELGQGGMAVVFLAQDLKHRRKVALKVLRPDLAAAVGAERFLTEIEVTAGLQHSNILPLFDSGEADGFLYYVMPFVEGESLRDLLDRERQLPVDEAVTIATEVAEALDFAHSRGVIHRDVKPENILLGAGHAVVADFGIARALGAADQDRLTRTGFTLGTPVYSSPEQLAGDEEVDGRADLYSLACVLHEMLTGDTPFQAPTLAAMLARKAEAVPPGVRALRPTVTPELEEVLLRALAPAPADRPRTGGAFSRELRAASPPPGAPPAASPMYGTSPRATPPTATSQGGSQGASPPAVTQAAGTPESRTPAASFLRKRGTLLLAALAVVLVAGAVFVWRTGVDSGPSQETLANRVVVLPYANETGDPTLDPVGRWLADWISDGLTYTTEVQAVPSSVVLEVLAEIRSEDPGSRGGSLLGSVAQLTRSGVAVTGSYYLRGSRLEIHSDIVDVGTGEALAAVDPVRVAADDPSPAADSVRAAVMGALATRLSRKTGWEFPPGVQPPTYEAFLAYSAGFDEWGGGSYDRAAEHFLRAYELDTTYVRSLLLAYGVSSGDRADSIRTIVMSKQETLAPYDRYRLRYLEAIKRHDRPAALVAAREGTELVPWGTLHTALVSLLDGLNRPAEALEESTHLQDHSPIARIWYVVPRNHAEILHRLGEHEEELAYLREVHDEVRGGHLHLRTGEARALAALGRAHELRQVMQAVAASSREPDLQPGEALWSIAREARAHGVEAVHAETLERALAWHREQPAAYRESVPGRFLLARLRYEEGAWAEAAAIFEELVDVPVVGVEATGHLGALAARRGDPAAARGVLEALAGMDPAGGTSTLWRSRISALLEEKAEAVALLRRAFNEGTPYGIWIHLDRDLEALRGYPPYEELIRPEG